MEELAVQDRPPVERLGVTERAARTLVRPLSQRRVGSEDVVFPSVSFMARAWWSRATMLPRPATYASASGAVAVARAAVVIAAQLGRNPLHAESEGKHG